jgi:N6-adenosine-specific RNA methylase IME4
MKKYKTILADPPWQQTYTGKRVRERSGSVENQKTQLEYPTLTVEQICGMNVGDFADDACHLWLWTTNQFLDAGFDVMRAWGFKYMAPITWVNLPVLARGLSTQLKHSFSGIRGNAYFRRIDTSQQSCLQTARAVTLKSH